MNFKGILFLQLKIIFSFYSCMELQMNETQLDYTDFDDHAG